MATRKKKKTPPRRPASTLAVSKTYFDEFSVVARKVLQVMELDPDLFDRFTKKQKMDMMFIKFVAPKVVVKEGFSVPRQYVKNIQQEVYEYLKQFYVGDPSIDLTYYDYFLQGIQFVMCMAKPCFKELPSFPGELFNETALKVFDHRNEKDNIMNKFLLQVHARIFAYTKINIRLYGYDFHWKNVKNTNTFAGHVILDSVEPQRVFLTHNKITRPAFRMGTGHYLSDQDVWLTIPYNEVISGSDDTRILDVYVQNHVLTRMKERMDTISTFRRNSELLGSLFRHQMANAVNGQVVFTYRDKTDTLMGYLPFTIEGNRLYVLSFLPLVSPSAPEGSRLCKALNIGKDELNFLGMDKLSFFRNTDFDAVPQLKAALIEAGLWHLTEIEPSNEKPVEYSRKASGLIAKFFQESKPEPNKEDVFEEIAGKY